MSKKLIKSNLFCSHFTIVSYFYHHIISPSNSSVCLSELVTALYLLASGETGRHRKSRESCRLMLNSSSQSWNYEPLCSSKQVLENFGFPLCGWVWAQVFLSDRKLTPAPPLDLTSHIQFSHFELTAISWIETYSKLDHCRIGCGPDSVQVLGFMGVWFAPKTATVEKPMTSTLMKFSYINCFELMYENVWQFGNCSWKPQALSWNDF